MECIIFGYSLTSINPQKEPYEEQSSTIRVRVCGHEGDSWINLIQGRPERKQNFLIPGTNNNNQNMWGHGGSRVDR
jgi:hypothetical protein